jgi:hypothetical protein
VRLDGDVEFRRSGRSSDPPEFNLKTEEPNGFIGDLVQPVERGAVLLREAGETVDQLSVPGELGGAADHPAISADGSTLAVADLNGNILLWDLKAKRGAGSVFVDGSAVPAITFQSNTSLLMIGSVGNNIKRLDISVPALTRRICRLAGRRLSKQEWQSLSTGLPYQPICGTNE